MSKPLLLMCRRSATGLALFACFLTVGCACAQAQCVPFNERAAIDNLKNFSADPASIVRTFRGDNDKIDRTVASYLVSDPELLPSVRKLIADAPTMNKRAIGAGLRRAELQCTAPKPDVARKIMDFVRKLGDENVFAGYVAITEEPTPQYSTGSGETAPADDKQIVFRRVER